MDADVSTGSAVIYLFNPPPNSIPNPNPIPSANPKPNAHPSPNHDATSAPDPHNQ